MKLWKFPNCNREFRRKNQHLYREKHNIKDHFQHKPVKIYELLQILQKEIVKMSSLYIHVFLITEKDQIDSELLEWIQDPIKNFE